MISKSRYVNTFARPSISSSKDNRMNVSVNFTPSANSLKSLKEVDDEDSPDQKIRM